MHLLLHTFTREKPKTQKNTIKDEDAKKIKDEDSRETIKVENAKKKKDEDAKKNQ